jgi:hypothetical protein
MRKEATMPLKEQRRKWAFVTGVLGFAVMIVGCSQRHIQAIKTNNLHNVECRKYQPNYSGITPILVNDQDGISKEDEMVFACEGEKVHWGAAPGSGITSIQVHFLNNEWPFRQPFQDQLNADGQNPTPDVLVGPLPPGFRAKAYKYEIHVVTSTGKVINLDPHFVHGGGGP